MIFVWCPTFLNFDSDFVLGVIDCIDDTCNEEFVWVLYCGEGCLTRFNRRKILLRLSINMNEWVVRFAFCSIARSSV